MEPIWSGLPPLPNIAVGLLVGFGLSIGVGRWCVSRFHKRWTAKLPRITEPEADKEIPRTLTGTIERAVFTIFVIVQPGPALPAMMVWLGLKMAANWNKDVAPGNASDAMDQKIFRNRHAFLGLLTGLLSLTFAWGGGMLTRLIMGLT